MAISWFIIDVRCFIVVFIWFFVYNLLARVSSFFFWKGKKPHLLDAAFINRPSVKFF